MNETLRLSVLMPVFNESRTLRTIVQRVLDASVELDIEIVAVDDESTDDSLMILHELAANDGRIKVIAQPKNRGKGAAIRTAISHMTGDLAIIQDADLEYDPDDYPKVLAPLLDGRADAVYGSRFAASEQRRVLMFWHSLGNRFLTALSNMANDLNLTDMETCYKAFRTDVLANLRLTSERFGIEPEITARLAQWGARIYEVPINYHGRTYAEGKTIGWRDGLQALWLIFKFRFIDTKFTETTSHETRQSIGRAKLYRGWLMKQFEGFLGNDVLEVMPGPGRITETLLGRSRLVAVDPNPVFVEGLRRRFGHMENVSFRRVDFDTPDSGDEDLGMFDTVVCLDGLQRWEDPKRAMERIAGHLRPGGLVLVQVPADPDLYGPTDRAAGHVRRFTEGDLRSLLEAVGLQVEFTRSFNKAGRIAWNLHHASGRDRITAGEGRLFDLGAPVAERLEPILPGTGLSFVAVARR